MGRIARLLSFARVMRRGAVISDAKCDPGGGANVTAEHFAPPGDDSHPLPGDYVALIAASGNGRETAAGYLDTINAPVASPGEKRMYARDGGGASVVSLWLKADGSALLSNGGGYIELKASGDVHINGAVIDTAGNITSPADITCENLTANVSSRAAGKELAGHIHTSGGGGDDTGPNK